MSESNAVLAEDIDVKISSLNEVADHYNKKNAIDLATRSKSKIFFLRNFNNWIKSVLINKYMTLVKENSSIKYFRPRILDLGCGRGGDILKWKKANVSFVTFADIADKSLEECQKRYKESNGNFQAEFLHLDATKELISSKVDPAKELHDLVSSQFVIHYSFESFNQADTFLKNVSDSIKVGGYFIGTTTNAYELIKRLRESNDHSFGNEIYKIKFEQTQDKHNIDLFGVKFDFQLDNVVECPEYLLNFEVLVKIAQKYNLKLILRQTFADFFNENSMNYENKNLLTIMQALEPYYPKENADQTESQINPDEYLFIDEQLKNDDFKRALAQNETYATLSKSEWEAINLYIVFAFEKIAINDEDHNKSENKVQECHNDNQNNSAKDGSGLKRKLDSDSE